MKSNKALVLRLRFFSDVVRKESHHLQLTNQKLFAQAFTLERAKALETDLALSESLDAFIGRFGRLQDTLGDKYLPLLLTAMGEPVGAAIDNLDKAERLGLIQSVNEWIVLRKLRNQMVHEYINDLSILVSAVQKGHQFVPVLLATAEKFVAETQKRVERLAQ